MTSMAKRLLSLFCVTVIFFGFLVGLKPNAPEVWAEEISQDVPEDVMPVNHDVSKLDIAYEGKPTVKVGITIVDQTTDLSSKVGEDTDEDFYPDSKKWNGIPTVAKAGNNIFVAWYTGGNQEPSVDNYICVAVSTDMGVTWKNPWMIIRGYPLGIVWPLFYRNSQNELCLGFGDNKMTGSQMIKIYNADGPLENITYSRPKITGAIMSITCKPTLIDDGSMLAAYGNNAFDQVPTTIIRSTDDGQTFSPYRTIKSTVADRYHDFAEVSIVQKKDKRLWALIRLCDGKGIEQSFSSDNGKTWTKATNDLSNPPFYSPGSRFYMSRLKSGALLFVTNMQGRNNDRKNMVAWLSEDDGETWPYSLVLDPTQSSYPDFCQDEDGLIYLVHDRDRYNEGGIRMHVFTEEDVKQGGFLSAQSKQGIIITKKDKSFGDIVSVGNAFEKVEKYKTGTELKEILSGKPKTITVTDDNGKEYQISGTYKVSGFKKDTAGTYQAYFSPDDELPSKLKDGYSNLKFKVVLEEDTNFFSNLSTNVIIGGCCLAVTAVVLVVTLVIKKKI